MAKTILVVDDSESIRELVSCTLMSAGYAVEKGTDGLDGLERLNNLQGDVGLVITDLNMPRMNGLEFVRRIRANPYHEYLPVLILTTESQLEKKLEAKRLGVTGWIVKPFDEFRLLKIVRTLIR